MTGERRDPATPDTVEEALRQSATHARNAIAEACLAAVALLDAISLPLTGKPARQAGSPAGLAGRGLATLSNRLIDVARLARSADAPLPDELLVAILDALDAEIARWELRSRSDADARPVLRAFLGLREILWEFGVRSPAAESPTENPGDVQDAGPDDAADVDLHDTSRPDADEPAPQRRRRTQPPAGRQRVQRIRVDD